MKVLIATEGSAFSKAAVQKCCRLFSESDNTEVRIISAVEPIAMSVVPFPGLVGYFPEDIGAAVRSAEMVVNRTEAEIRDLCPTLALGLTTKVVTGVPPDVIVEEAETWGADLIVVGSHGYGPVQRALLGSVSDLVLRHAPCSVLVVRQPREH